MFLQQTQQLQQGRAQPVVLGHAKHAAPRSRLLVCGFKRGAQPAEAAQPSSTTTSAEPQVVIAVPIEQPPEAAQQQARSGPGMAWILVAAAVAAGLVFKKLKSMDPSQGASGAGRVCVRSRTKAVWAGSTTQLLHMQGASQA